ncbi:CHASE3 domain-containing protein [Scytonema sp. NUACC21]
MKWLIERKILTCGFGLAVLILAVVNTVSYQNTAKLFTRQKQVESSYEVLQKVRDILTTLRDAERARRGYIITGKQSYLETYDTAIQSINTEFKEARSATAYSYKQQQKLNLIEPLITERVNLIKKSIQLYKQNRYDTTNQIALTDKGLMLHDQIWRIIAEIENEEQLLLQHRRAESEQSFQFTTTMTIAGSCFSFGLLFAIYSLLQEQICQRQQLEKVLRESKKRYRKLFEVNPHPLWVYDLETLKFLVVNEVAVKQYGYSQADFLSMTIKNIFPPEDISKVLNRILQLSSEFKQVAIERHQKQDGTLIDVEVTSHELIFRGRLARLVLARDITLEKQAREAAEIRRNLEKELEMHELKTRFFSMVSHEFRTPLSTILISAQVLENSKEWSEEKKRKNLQRIQSSAKTMTQLLTDILTLTRAEAGKLEFKPQPLNLEEFCYLIVEEIQFSTRAQQEIIFVNNSWEKIACMDEKLLRSIIGNLLDNAIKYSPPDRQIYFTLTKESGQAIFQISDRGIGIAQEEKEQLYQAFQRGKNVGDIPGTGLGLAVVKKCLELHEGTITLESQLGIGTTFTVSLAWKQDCFEPGTVPRQGFLKDICMPETKTNQVQYFLKKDE